MRDASEELVSALESRTLKARNFIWLTGYDFSTRVAHSIGFHNDLGTWDVEYEDVNTKATQTRQYIGGGSLVQLDNIPLTSSITVRNVEVKFSQIDSNVAAIVRGYDLHQAPVEIHRGIMYPGTFKLVEPAKTRFVGFVDTCKIEDPAEGNEGSITLGLVSHTRLLTRTNSDVRSGQSQRLRLSGDAFYDDAATIGKRQIFWGVAKGNPAA